MEEVFAVYVCLMDNRYVWSVQYAESEIQHKTPLKFDECNNE